MRSVTGALLFLSGSVLIGAGVIAQSTGHGSGDLGKGCCALGGLTWFIAVAVMISGIGSRLPVSRPVDEKDR